MTAIYRFKAGDTFSLVAALPLQAGVNWAARAQVRHPYTGAKIADLTVTLDVPDSPTDSWPIHLEALPAVTTLWTRPADARSVEKLVCDIEIYDADDATKVVSLETFEIHIQFDPTRP